MRAKLFFLLLAGGVIGLATLYGPLYRPAARLTPPDQPVPEAATLSEEARCLGLNVYWEAAMAKEPLEGMRMVAYVTHERMRQNRPYWGGNTLCGVVYAKRTTLLKKSKERPKGGSRTVYQFDWVRVVKDPTPRNRQRWVASVEVAEDEIAGRYQPPRGLMGATSYLNPHFAGKRNIKEFATRNRCLGTVEGSQHLFFRDATAAERAGPQEGRFCATAIAAN